MDKEQLLQYVEDRFSVSPDFPWEGEESYVLRHPSSRKWFAVGLRVPYARLGLAGDGAAEIVDVKTGPLLMGSYLGQPGILPGYHMNKNHWLTILLDGTAKEEQVKELLEISYDLT